MGDDKLHSSLKADATLQVKTEFCFFFLIRFCGLLTHVRFRFLLLLVHFPAVNCIASISNVETQWLSGYVSPFVNPVFSLSPLQERKTTVAALPKSGGVSDDFGVS